jgi:hypothetical protein
MKFEISDLRFEISDFRFQISDFRFQISDSRECIPLIFLSFIFLIFLFLIDYTLSRDAEPEKTSQLLSPRRLRS